MGIYIHIDTQCFVRSGFWTHISVCIKVFYIVQRVATQRSLPHLALLVPVIHSERNVGTLCNHVAVCVRHHDVSLHVPQHLGAIAKRFRDDDQHARTRGRSVPVYLSGNRNLLDGPTNLQHETDDADCRRRLLRQSGVCVHSARNLCGSQEVQALDQLQAAVDRVVFRTHQRRNRICSFAEDPSKSCSAQRVARLADSDHSSDDDDHFGRTDGGVCKADWALGRVKHRSSRPHCSDQHDR